MCVTEIEKKSGGSLTFRTTISQVFYLILHALFHLTTLCDAIANIFLFFFSQEHGRKNCRRRIKVAPPASGWPLHEHLGSSMHALVS